MANFAAQNGFAASTATGTLVVNPAALAVTASSATLLTGRQFPQSHPATVGLCGPDNAATGHDSSDLLGYSSPPEIRWALTPRNARERLHPTTRSPTCPVTLSITAVPLTITANNVSRAFGVPNPTFTASYVTLVNGDTPASLTGTLSCTSTATATSLPGPYPITCSGQTSTNYNITYVPGTLTVTAVGPVLTLNPTALAFTSPLGVTTVSQAVTVSNTGSAALRITGITLAGANPYGSG